MKNTEPVVVSNTVLAPGSHLWTLMDSQSDRHIVQISNEGTHRVEAVIFAVPKYRNVITQDNEVQFWETPLGYAKAIRTWFRPSESYGQEFPYSKKVVLKVGRVGTTVIPMPRQLLTPRPKRTAKSVTIRPHMERASAQSPSGSWAIISDVPPTADAAQRSPKQQPPQPTRTPDGIWDKIKRLPLTATLVPLIGLIGAGFLLAFFLSGHRRENRQA